MDSAQRLLLREGVIDEIPPDLCGNAKNASKNVILVVGDGMGVSFPVSKEQAPVQRHANDLTTLLFNRPFRSCTVGNDSRWSHRPTNP